MIKVEKVVKTGFGYPAQWEGVTNDNRQIYVRYRRDFLEICLGEIGDMSEFGGVGGEEVMSLECNGKHSGLMDYAELKELSADVVDFPEFESERVDWQANEA